MSELTTDRARVEATNFEDYSSAENYDIGPASLQDIQLDTVHPEPSNEDMKKHSEHSKTTTKRKKIDKDGFVQPNTPEIHTKSARCSIDEPSSVESDSNTNSSPITGHHHEDPIHHTSGGRPVNREVQASQPPSLVTLLKELAEEAKSINHSWGEIFNDSENFEMFCPTRLDKILQETLALEENLRQQKETLCNRLHALSHTLQLP